MKPLDWPLMRGNITLDDLSDLRNFLNPLRDDLQLTNGPQVRAFEEEFAAWLGCRYAVMVNSGASANLITMAAVAERESHPRVLVPCVTWISDIAAVLHAGVKPHFCDIRLDTLGIDWERAPEAGIAFPTHCLGFDADVPAWRYKNRVVIEDCCESLGATRDGKKLGTLGLASNFSFYYAHHMSTIEGGMVCTDDRDFYETCRRLRSHGLVREMDHEQTKLGYAAAYPDLDPSFIFTEPAYNVRSTELNAVIGRSQLKRLDVNVKARSLNLLHFLSNLSVDKYRTCWNGEFRTEGSSNYALPLILKEPDVALMDRVIALIKASGVEYRRGTAGGGNQLRQPYAKKRWGVDFHKQFPNAEHVHLFGLYVGNFPDLEAWKIDALCEGLNAL